MLDAIVSTANIETKKFQSVNNINTRMINTHTSGNGDITSILKVIPNVQFDNTQMKSATPGEIDPANISISGGLFYQNNFQLDGFNMNNDLDPKGQHYNGPDITRGTSSQGLAVDTSLLESISVQDSNISAAYGGFTGGVVEANIRKPRNDKWHGNVSYQFTGNKLTQYHIDSSQQSNFIASSNENYQPYFTKHLIRANIEGYITNNFGIVSSFSTTRSFIPLKSYAFNIGQDVNSTREQHRYIDNYYIKTHYNPTENLNIEANIAYIPQDNTYYNPNARKSFYSMNSGGVQSGLKALYDTDIGLWTNTLGYSWMQNSRKSEANYFISWYYSPDKNWATFSEKGGKANEGGYGDMNQIQNTLNYKSDMNFDSIDIWKTTHRFLVGTELSFTHALRNRLNNYYTLNDPVELPQGQTCAPDSMFDFETCSNVGFDSPKPSKPPTQPPQKWHGQYFNQATETKAGKIGFGNFAYGFYIEDSMNADFDKYGNINVRFGLRLDGDSYMDKHTIAHRLSMNYIAPWEDTYKSTIIFGVNRYYGRNLLSYRLYDFVSSNLQEYNRKDQNSPWILNTDTPTYSDYAFNKLNVPYDDEIVIGFSQNIWMFELIGKYIHRDGKDEVMSRKIKIDKRDTTIWTNDGSSRSDIVTLMLQNQKAIEFYGIKNYILFGFDYTQVNRSYNIYNADDAYFNNVDIIYNGQIIKYRDRPVENYARPFTLRLSTTHIFNIWKTKWIWNNFFRYRDGYEQMVVFNKNSPGYNPNYPDIDQYGKMRFHGAFTWDIRLGVEIDIYKGNTLYCNIDIYNVLNAANMIALGGAYPTYGFASSSSVAVYEIGRQFWLQFGYKI